MQKHVEDRSEKAEMRRLPDGDAARGVLEYRVAPMPRAIAKNGA